jgi:hypothetical protein
MELALGRKWSHRREAAGHLSAQCQVPREIPNHQEEYSRSFILCKYRVHSIHRLGS